MYLTLSKQSARRFLLKKQLLWPPKSLSGGKSIETVFNTLRVIQYDPLNPCGRNPDLVLQTRIKNYHPEEYYDWLYKQRKGMECYDKELCIIPIEDYPLTSYMRAKAQEHPRLSAFVKEHHDELEQILERFAKEGPLSSTEFMDKRQVDMYWSMGQWGRAALETLWKLGKIVIVKRVKGKKFYDLPHKAYGETYRYKEHVDLTIGAEHILRRLNSVGILPRSGSGSGWQGLRNGREVSRIIELLLKEKTLTEIEIKNIKQRYVIQTSDRYLLEDKKRIMKKMIFIAPLDTLMWDREMIMNFFDFHYRWEVYTPAKQRKYGYYTLPILYGDEFIGRIEPVLKKNVLEIRGLWFEKKIRITPDIIKELDKTLDTFASYLGASIIKKLYEKTG